MIDTPIAIATGDNVIITKLMYTRVRLTGSVLYGVCLAVRPGALGETLVKALLVDIYSDWNVYLLMALSAAKCFCPGWGALRPKMGRCEGSVGWIFTPTGVSMGWIFTGVSMEWFLTQQEYQIFTKITQEWPEVKIPQISPKKNGSKWKSNTQRQYVWHLNTQPVPEVKKGV